MASPAIIKKIFIIVRLQHATIVITRIVQKGAGIMAEHILVVDEKRILQTWWQSISKTKAMR